MADGIPDWYEYLRGAKALGVSPFVLDDRARRTRRHPVWRYWAATAEMVEPPKFVRIAGLT